MLNSRKNLVLVFIVLSLAAHLAHSQATAPATQPAAGEPEMPLDQMIPELQCDSMPLGAVIDKLNDETHANLIVDWPSLEAAGVSKQNLIRLHLWKVPLRTALSVVLQVASSTAPIEFRDSEGVVTISTTGRFPGRLTTRVYDIRDLIDAAAEYQKNHPYLQSRQEPANQLFPVPVDFGDIASRYVNLINSTLEREGGIETDGPLHVDEIAGSLVVSTTPKLHQRVVALLKMYRSPSRDGSLPATMPAGAAR
jgi:hypothetical protein